MKATQTCSLTVAPAASPPLDLLILLLILLYLLLRGHH